MQRAPKARECCGDGLRILSNKEVHFCNKRNTTTARDCRDVTFGEMGRSGIMSEF